VFRHVSFDAIHVFRLYMEPFAAPYRKANPAAMTQLDLDEVESVTRRRLAALHRLNGETGRAIEWSADAHSYERMERSTLRHYGRVFVSSKPERERLGRRLGIHHVEVLPNVATEPPPLLRVPRDRSGPFIFLFVGNLSYYPNVDAVCYFAEQVLPRLRREAGCEVIFELIGPGARPSLVRRWRRLPGVRYVGPVDELGSYYDRANAVTTPIRAGGGTRIKILEAFARQLPVVTTTLGAEGIDVVPGKHLLTADSPETLTEACLELVRNPALIQQLTANALALYQDSYRPSVMRDILLRRCPLPAPGERASNT
jgi:glycosyltransferase involved in cell wall biosynthesis